MSEQTKDYRKITGQLRVKIDTNNELTNIVHQLSKKMEEFNKAIHDFRAKYPVKYTEPEHEDDDHDPRLILHVITTDEEFADYEKVVEMQYEIQKSLEYLQSCKERYTQATDDFGNNVTAMATYKVTDEIVIDDIIIE